MWTCKGSLDDYTERWQLGQVYSYTVVCICFIIYYIFSFIILIIRM